MRVTKIVLTGWLLCLASTVEAADLCGTHTVTLSAGVTRNPGDPVWLKRDSSGTNRLNGPAPDIGAFERQP